MEILKLLFYKDFKKLAQHLQLLKHNNNNKQITIITKRITTIIKARDNNNNKANNKKNGLDEGSNSFPFIYLDSANSTQQLPTSLFDSSSHTNKNT